MLGKHHTVFQLRNSQRIGISHLLKTIGKMRRQQVIKSRFWLLTLRHAGKVVSSHRSCSYCHIWQVHRSMFIKYTVIAWQSSHWLGYCITHNCTNRLQPLDVSVNKAMKENPRKQFQNWFSSQVSKHTDGAVMLPVDLRMSLVKHLGATWIITLKPIFQ